LAPSLSFSFSACARTCGVACAKDAVFANSSAVIAVSAVVASSTRRVLVMAIWFPGKVFVTGRAINKQALGRNVAPWIG
jgi:hypothetical protein